MRTRVVIDPYSQGSRPIRVEFLHSTNLNGELWMGIGTPQNLTLAKKLAKDIAEGKDPKEPNVVAEYGGDAT